MPKALAFISHSSKDKEFATRLAEELRRRDIDIWIDHEQIRYGDSIPGKITDGLKRCDVILVLLSGSFLTSSWCRSEYEPLLTREINEDRTVVIALRLDDAEVPILLSHKRYVNLRDGLDHTIVDELADAISSRRTGTTVKRPASKKARSFSVRVRTGATQIQSSQFFTKEALSYYLWWDFSLSPYVEPDDIQRFKTFFEKTAPRHTEFVHAVEEIRPFLPRLDLPGVPTYYPSEMGIERIDLKTNILVTNSGHTPMRIKLPQECAGEIADRRVNLPPGWKCTYGLVMEGSNVQIDPKKDHLISASCWLKVTAPDTIMGRLSDWGKYGFSRARASRNFVQFLQTGTVSCGPCMIHLLDDKRVRFTLQFNLATELCSIRLTEVEVDHLEKQWKIVTDEYYKYVRKLERYLEGKA